MTHPQIHVPAHLFGPMGTRGSPALVAERNALILVQVDLGHTYRAIGAAFGVSAVAVSRAALAARARPPVEVQPAPPQRDAGGLLKFKVTGTSPVSGLFSHFIRAVDAEAAALRALRAHPKGSTIEDIHLVGAEREVE